MATLKTAEHLNISVARVLRFCFGAENPQSKTFIACRFGINAHIAAMLLSQRFIGRAQSP